MQMMVSLKMTFEMSKLMQEYESIQLAIAHVLGGEVKDSSPGSRFAKMEGTEIRNMNSLISAFQTIGGKVGS